MKKVNSTLALTCSQRDLYRSRGAIADPFFVCRYDLAIPPFRNAVMPSRCVTAPPLLIKPNYFFPTISQRTAMSLKCSSSFGQRELDKTCGGGARSFLISLARPRRPCWPM